MNDLISRQAAIRIASGYCHPANVAKELAKLPSVQPVDKDINVSCKDAISRQAAIRWVKTECNPYGKPTLDFESGKRVMEHLKIMPSVQPEPHWIPCSDKIPSEAQECWITAKDGTVCQGMFTRQYGERRDSGFICNNGFAWLNAVVAWMPYDMPEPYQKEGE